MATAGEHLDVAQEWHVLFQVGNMLGGARKRNDHVVISGNVEGGHGNLDAFEGRHQLPIAIDIAIVVERPAKTATREYTRLAKHVASAAVFGPSNGRAAKLGVLPADIIPRFEAAQDPIDLLNSN
jgi:hypothetical protein